MKKIAVVMFCLAVTMSALFGDPNTLSLFRYDPAKMNPGTMYSYEFRDLDGKKWGDFYYYIKNDGNMEQLSEYTMGVLFIKYAFDKSYFVFDKMTFKNLFAYMRIPQHQTHGGAQWDFNKKRNIAEAFYVDKQNKDAKTVYDTNAQFLPCYDLNFCQIDFALAMRHFIGKKTDTFEVGVMYGGNFAANTVSFEKEEIINGIRCDKWVIKGKGVLALAFNVKQELWFAKDDPYYRLVQYKNYMSLTKRHLLLTNVTTMTEAEWQAFIAKKTEEMRIKLGYPKEGEK